MQLTDAITVFTNPEAHTQDKVVSAAFTISAELKVKPNVARLFRLLPDDEVPDYEQRPLPDLADELGLIKAGIANLEKSETKIKNIFHISGETEIEGAYFVATVGNDYTRRSISLETLEKKHPKIYKMLQPYIKITNAIGMIHVRARS